MNRDQAAARVRLLREVRTDRGATVHEQTVAQQKAARLVERFGLDRHEARARRASSGASRPRSAPAAGFSGWAPDAHMPEWLRGRPVPDWSFDPKTGKASGNVKVREYHNVGNWKIEIDV